MKKIMILGGGDNQLPLIQSARSLGYYVIVCDSRAYVSGIALADKYIAINTSDYESVLSAAKDNDIDGIITNSEPVIPIMTNVANVLRLRCNPLVGIDTLMSKSLFRNLQKRLGLYCPSHYIISDKEELFSQIKRLNYPIIIKPCESSGSRGTKKISAFDHLLIESAYDECVKYSRNGQVTIEEFVEMYSLTTIEGEVFLYNDQIIWEGLFSTTRASFAPMVPMTYSITLILSEERMELIRSSLKKVFHATGMNFGEFNIEGYFTKKGDFFIVEINVRQGGHRLPDFVFENTNIDMTKLLVSLSVNDETYWNELKNIKRLYQSAVRHVVFSPISGIFDNLEIDNRIKDYVVRSIVLKEKGEEVERCINGSNVVAIVDILFPSIEIGHELYNKLEHLIKVKLR